MTTNSANNLNQAKSEKPNLVVTNIFNKCQEFSKQLFAEFGEPAAIVFTISWNIGKNDFPAGTFITRDVVGSDLILDILSQLSKQEQRLVGLVVEQYLRSQEKVMQLTNSKSEDVPRNDSS